MKKPRTSNVRGVKFRKGRKAKRTLYLQLGDQPADDDPIIGIVDNEALAGFLVEGGNELLLSNPLRRDTFGK